MSKLGWHRGPKRGSSLDDAFSFLIFSFKEHIMKVTKIKGTLDFYQSDAKKYRYLQKIASGVAESFGFREMITPIFEATEVFVRSVGEGSDIVNKEMYTFIDRGDRSITLRPEGTAPVTRAFVENKLYAVPGIHKYYYFGPMFRYERPQAGRLRQFTQFGVEAFGGEHPYLDADIINLNYQILQALGIKNIKVLINSIGSGLAREKYVEALKKHFEPHLFALCDDCKQRFQKNTLRMLDCKVDSQNPVMQSAPIISDYLPDEDLQYFQDVMSALTLYGIPFEKSDRLVRGLDYYTNTVFEIVYDDEKSPLNNLALSAGGRYNSLTREFDGPDYPAMGFAMGVERLMMVMDELGITVSETNDDSVTVITLGEEMKKQGLLLTQFLRLKGKTAEIDYQSHNLKPQFKLADRMGSRYIVIIGLDEFVNNQIRIKDTKEKTEKLIPVQELTTFFGIEGEKYAYQK